MVKYAGWHIKIKLSHSVPRTIMLIYNHITKYRIPHQKNSISFVCQVSHLHTPWGTMTLRSYELNEVPKPHTLGKTGKMMRAGEMTWESEKKGEYTSVKRGRMRPSNIVNSQFFFFLNIVATTNHTNNTPLPPNLSFSSFAITA